MTYFNWPVIETTVFAEMPAVLRRPVPTEWSRANKGGAAVDCFLEGPCWDAAGNLWLVDIPHGRILRVSPQGDWAAVAEYDGEPNGLALRHDGTLLIADYKNGLLSLDPATGVVSPFLTRRNSERFKGPNDLVVARNGDVYFTDQGQTGLHDPTGRVYRLRADGRLDCLLSNGPSPNGLVLTPDESVLFVAMTRDRSTTNRGVWGGTKNQRSRSLQRTSLSQRPCTWIIRDPCQKRAQLEPDIFKSRVGVGISTSNPS